MADSVQQMRAEVNNAIDGRLDTLNRITSAMYALRRVPSTLRSPTTSATWLQRAEIHKTREDKETRCKSELEVLTGWTGPHCPWTAQKQCSE